MRDQTTAEKMTTFLVKFAQSKAPKWKQNLQANLAVYHVDVVVNAGGRSSSFVIDSSQVERVTALLRSSSVYPLMLADSMIDSAVLSQVRDSTKDLKWRVPIAGMLYPKTVVPRELDLQSSYVALRRYMAINRRERRWIQVAMWLVIQGVPACMRWLLGK